VGRQGWSCPRLVPIPVKNRLQITDFAERAQGAI
jgi:hypothetical protein